MMLISEIAEIVDDWLWEHRDIPIDFAWVPSVIAALALIIAIMA